MLNDVDAMYSVKSGQLKPVYETFNPIDASRWRYGAALAVASFVDWRSYAGAEMTPPQTQSNTEPTYGNTGFFEHPSDSTYRARWGNPYGWETQFFNGGSLFSNWNPNWNTYVDTRNNDNKVVTSTSACSSTAAPSIRRGTFTTDGTTHLPRVSRGRLVGSSKPTRTTGCPPRRTTPAKVFCSLSPKPTPKRGTNPAATKWAPGPRR